MLTLQGVLGMVLLLVCDLFIAMRQDFTEIRCCNYLLTPPFQVKGIVGHALQQRFLQDDLTERHPKPVLRLEA
jgi:hypothetical protein